MNDFTQPQQPQQPQGLEAGMHLTKVDKWGLRETNNGSVQIWIRFENGAHAYYSPNDGDPARIMSEALIICGFRYNELVDLFRPDALDKNKDVQISIKYEPNPNDPSKPLMRTSVIDPNRTVKGDIDKNRAMQILGNLSISNYVNEARSKAGGSNNGGYQQPNFNNNNQQNVGQFQNNTHQQPQNNGQQFNANDIPF